MTLPFTVSAQFSGIQVPQRGPQNVTIHQKEYCHDIAILQIWADDVDADSYYSGMPMQMVFGRPGGTRTFYGYVNHAERMTSKLNPATLVEANSTVITCVGASWLMKQAGNKAWFNQTATQVITQIAQQFGLSIQVTPHSTVWPVLQMAGMSYWEFCVSLAQRIGFTFYCSGIQLVCKPRNTNPQNLTGYVRAYDYKKDPNSLLRFLPTVGASSPTGGQLANRQLAGVNPRTQAPFVALAPGNVAPTTLGVSPDSPIFAKIQHETVNSAEEATATVGGSSILNQLYMTASAFSVGDPNISQGSLIYVRNVNGAQDGLWFVQGADHQIDPSTYSLSLALGRDSRGITAISSFPPATANAPSASLTSSVWMAA